ncbi:nicotinate (nicotinamide) nucleotide adenylyltransferase [Helicobacter sp. MIT 99-5507]|uniref:nicotinate (nicotinamide) nucleotide adenylyltransferase n=1 Tax=Helicobacter sp. MIT 99-5507 TaxID=152489 RepID=UPI000E1E9E5D|nr:nicotinate (nicotinamide) nucleotide adenylyltransferase [Helicobacter sp. MIT 99-5507]RDU58286.1 nicotinate (nicotinamide) nucleotide adenylyltransferase [Helicobacter sp. MIT 99-5507]
MECKIAIFGGSFDPPHKGHKAIVDELLKLDFLDLIIILPAFLNPFKNKPLFLPQKRLELLNEIIKKDKRILISNFEIKQKITHSIDSIKYFKDFYKPDSIYFVIGADILQDLYKWHKIDEILNEVNLIIARRNDIDIESSEFYKKDKTIILDTNYNISSTILREQYFANFKDY